MTLPVPISLDEAQAKLFALARPLGGERLPVADAAGRYLTETLLAARTQPPADLSAMDGYAVRGDDMEGPWSIVGESAAGHPFHGAIKAGEAIRISTGAIMPVDAGAVILQENAKREGDVVRLTSDDGPSTRHIRRAGFDFERNDTLLRAGERIDAAQIALATAGGHSDLEVGKLPSIVIIDSGDELASDPARVSAGQIPASNGIMIAAMAKPLTAACKRIGPIPDQIEAMVSALDGACDADVIVTSGGASVGDHDVVRPALEKWGASLEFWRIAMRPGKPLMVARKGSTLILGLPGNPVSSYVTAFLFLLPLLRRLSGSGSPLPSSIMLPLLEAIGQTGSREEFVRGLVTPDGVLPITQRDSSAMLSLSQANALIRRPTMSPPADKDEQAVVYLLQNGGIA